METTRLGEEGKTFFPHSIRNEGFRVVLSADEARGYIMRRLETSKMPEHSDRSNRGFSLIELLIVVAVILILAGIAIPNLIGAKMSANEASAVASLRTLAGFFDPRNRFSTAADSAPITSPTRLSVTGASIPHPDDRGPACFS